MYYKLLDYISYYIRILYYLINP